MTQEEMKEYFRDGWKEVLHVDEVNDDSDFFEAGGNSIMAVQLPSWLVQKGIKLDMMDIFITPSFGELAKTLKETAPVYMPEEMITKEKAAEVMGFSSIEEAEKAERKMLFGNAPVPPAMPFASMKKQENETAAREENASQVCTPAQDENASQVCTPAQDENASQVCTPAQGENASQVCTPAQGENASQVCTPAQGENASQVCTPAQGENASQVCTPAQGTDSQVCTPAQGENASQVCTPAQGTASQVCTPAQMNASQVCTPAQGTASQVCTPAQMNASQVCTPAQMNASQVCTPAQGTASQVCTPAQGTASQVCTPAQGTASQVCTPAQGENASQVCTPAQMDAAQICTPVRQSMPYAFFPMFVPLQMFGGTQFAGASPAFPSQPAGMFRMPGTNQGYSAANAQNIPPQLRPYFPKQVDKPVEKPNVVKITKAEVSEKTKDPEKALMDVMTGIMPSFDRNRDFFEQGLTSLDTVKMVTRCAEAGYVLEMKDIFMHSTFDELLNYLK